MHFNKLFTALAITLTLSLGYFTKTINDGSYVAKNANLESIIYPAHETASFDTALYPNWKQANEQERFFSDRWEEIARIPDIDTCIYPHWEQADSLCFDTYPGDLRYTDMWCEIASKRPIELGAQIMLVNSHHSHNCNYNEK
jgi:hypothetical protein